MRSQDREAIARITGILIEEKEIRGFTETTSYYKLGNYKTKERAIEVLDEIHKRLINLGTLEIAPDSYRVLPKETSNVYEMPKE